ncbi:MAG: hypothetical protein COB02_00295 [Candidatus Cloacimonadota bacterium]|nr:MAG: hypothetical protein COB02_00295 [Candidatus Cloacimonadota bacterium]
MNKKINDSSDLKENNTPLILDSIDSGIMVIEKDLSVSYLNPYGNNLLNKIGSIENYKNVLFDERFKNLIDLVKQSFEEGKISRVDIYFSLESSLNEVWLGLCLKRVFDQQAQKKIVIITFRDISEIKFLEQKRMHDSNLKSIELLSSGTAHEFNNIFAGVSGYLELFQANDKYKEKFTKVVEDAVVRGTEIVNRLLNFSFQHVHLCEDRDIKDSIDEIRDLYSYELKNREIKFVNNIEIGLIVEIDKNLLKQIIIDIMTNAIHAISTKGLISVDSEADEKFIWVKFKDSGVGLEESKLEHLFTPFYTTKGALGASGEEGKGLGLYFIYTSIRAIGGDVFVESIGKQGTVFVLKFPRKIIPTL